MPLHSQGDEITVVIHCPKWRACSGYSESKRSLCAWEKRAVAYGNQEGRQQRKSSALLEKVLGAWHQKKCQRRGTFSIKAVGKGQSPLF